MTAKSSTRLIVAGGSPGHAARHEDGGMQMAAPEVGPEAQSWPLRGFWRIWLWFSAWLAALLLIGGVALVTLIGVGAFVPAIVLFLVGAMIGWQVAYTATAVTLGADGELILTRLLGPLRTQATRVRRARPSRLKSSYTPTVIETADGWAYLVHTQEDRNTVIDALRRHNPTMSAET